jgi:hypothetical protein
MYSSSAKNLTQVGQIHAKPNVIDWIECKSLTWLKIIKVELGNSTKSMQNQVSPKIFMVVKGVYKWWMPLKSFEGDRPKGLEHTWRFEKPKGLQGDKG